MGHVGWLGAAAGVPTAPGADSRETPRLQAYQVQAAASIGAKAACWGGVSDT